MIGQRMIGRNITQRRRCTTIMGVERTSENSALPLHDSDTFEDVIAYSN